MSDDSVYRITLLKDGINYTLVGRVFKHICGFVKDNEIKDDDIVYFDNSATFSDKMKAIINLDYVNIKKIEGKYYYDYRDGKDIISDFLFRRLEFVHSKQELPFL